MAEEGDVYWWEAWEDDPVEKKHAEKRAENPNLDAEDAVWQARLHGMSVEVCACCVGHLSGAIVGFAYVFRLYCDDYLMTVGLPIQELKREVTQLQASVFSTSTTTSDIQIPVHRKQQRLRYFNMTSHDICCCHM